ncbi:MAG: acylphosphatase [Solobacterium sp.]|jgi:acylphosphatase|nr:acylphosphatase [Solobacterium sp.]
MKRYHVFVEGRVQGVGFRSFCMLNAQRLNLTGNVKNLTNGIVEMFVQGEEADIDRFLAVVEKGNTWIRVDEISVKSVPVVEGEKKFGYSHY